MTRTILITGATRGLGRALTEQWANEGHRLVVCGRDPGKVAELQELLGPQAPGHRCSTSPTARRSPPGRSEVLPRFGPPDLLLNNAGLINNRAPLWQVPPEELSRVVDVNMKGAAYLVHAFVPAMIARGSGVIVNLSSGWGHFTSPEVAPYCATKFAIEGLTRSLAQELPPGLAAIPVSPGIIHTEMLDAAMGESAAGHWEAAAWVETAAPFLLSLGPEQNGKSVRIPGS